ncbi:helix-turn-helix domain-containing protein [Falsirhodobacter xinxiangensis]|uniref:helix-turn-helix domain-containing protein n=1 Tax=Falsirhodobacter xinxiangensis TaxID=2530049 RepID=UPI0033130244
MKYDQDVNSALNSGRRPLPPSKLSGRLMPTPRPLTGPAEVLSPSQVAGRWGCCANTVRTLIRTGKLKAFPVGSRRLGITRQSLHEYEETSHSGARATGGAA